MAQSQPAASPPAAVYADAVQDVSLSGYSAHLAALLPVLDSCAHARDSQACNPAQVGPDDRVALAPGSRIVHYAWLRALLKNAGEKPSPAPAAAQDEQPGAPTVVTLLQQARTRLEADLAESAQSSQPAPAHVQQHAVLRQVLAADAYRRLNHAPRQNIWLERLGAWLNSLFARANLLRSHSSWLGRVLVWGFVLAVCVALVWRLLQMERRWRARLMPSLTGPAPGAPSARDWQIWLADARREADAARWREALHFLYWASIARLESRRLWPADRARTPREYLALVGEDDPRKPRLAALSAAFERTWYGGRPAAETDYRAAEQLALALIEGDAR